MFWDNPIHRLCDFLKPYISPILVQKFIFYDGNIHPCIPISWSEHEAHYLIYYDESCNPISTSHEASMHPSISYLMKEIFSFISVLYRYILFLHKSYISRLLYHVLQNHEINNMLIKTNNNVYAQHNSKVQEYTYLHASHETY